MRLNLDGAEVWRGLTFLGTVSADWLAAQIQDRLDNIEIAEWLRSELASDPTRHLGPPRDSGVPIPADREGRQGRPAGATAEKQRQAAPILVLPSGPWRRPC